MYFTFQVKSVPFLDQLLLILIKTLYGDIKMATEPSQDKLDIFAAPSGKNMKVLE